MPAETIAAATGISITSIYRYKKTGVVPPMVAHLVNLTIHGHLPSAHRAWRGWTVRDDALISPEGETFCTGQIRAAHLYRDVSQDAQRQLRALRDELAELRGQLAHAGAALDAAREQVERMVTAGPIRVQLVAIDSDGRQTALTAPVAPVVRVAVPEVDPWHHSAPAACGAA